jgi:hypothetical protein
LVDVDVLLIREFWANRLIRLYGSMWLLMRQLAHVHRRRHAAVHPRLEDAVRF